MINTILLVVAIALYLLAGGYVLLSFLDSTDYAARSRRVERGAAGTFVFVFWPIIAGIVVGGRVLLSDGGRR